MTTETLFADDRPLRFKIIRPVYEVLTVNDTAAQYFEPLEAISSSSHVVRLFDFLGTYKLTVTVTIVEQDDPAARKHAKGIIEALGEVVSDAEVKLQQVHQDNPPRGARIG